jgi:hypothetical protein
VRNSALQETVSTRAWQVFSADRVKENVTAERFIVILSAAKDLGRPAAGPDSSLRQNDSNALDRFPAGAGKCCLLAGISARRRG